MFLDHGRRALARHRVRGDARLHPLRRVPQRVPGVPPHRRGHAYDAVYSGPMGKVLTPLLSLDGDRGRDLPDGVDAVRRVHRGVPGRDPARRPPGAAARPTCVAPAPSTRSPPPPRAPGPGPGVTPRRPGEGDDSRVLRTPLASRPRPAGARRAAFDAWARVWSSPAGYVRIDRARRASAPGSSGAAAIRAGPRAEGARARGLDRDTATRRDRRDGRSGIGGPLGPEVTSSGEWIGADPAVPARRGRERDGGARTAFARGARRASQSSADGRAPAHAGRGAGGRPAPRGARTARRAGVGRGRAAARRTTSGGATRSGRWARA